MCEGLKYCHQKYRFAHAGKQIFVCLNRRRIYNKKFIVITIAEQSFFSGELKPKHAPMLSFLHFGPACEKPLGNVV
jgi:hypothetical protein